MRLPATEVTQTVNVKHIPSRPLVQGSSAPLHLRSEGATLTDGVGLVAPRQLWDRLDLGRWLRTRTSRLPRRYRPELMVEVWTALLVYGGGWLDDLKWLRRRQVQRLFGGARFPIPPRSAGGFGAAARPSPRWWTS